MANRRNLLANAPFDKSVKDLPIKNQSVGVVIGSGPSLNLELDQLANSLKLPEVYSICCDGSIWDMKEAKIKPNAVITCEIDSQHERPGCPSTEQILLHGDLDYYKRTPLICPTWANRAFLKMWPGPKYFYLNSDLQYKGIVDRHSKGLSHIPKVRAVASMVGFHAVALFDVLGFPEVHTYGFDCCVVDGEHHSKHFPLKEWEVDLTRHFKSHQNLIIKESSGRIGHPNVINYSPLTVIKPPEFECEWPYEGNNK